MKIMETTCKTALSTSRLPGLNYALNPYVGCMHQCHYCYAPSILHMSFENWGHTVSFKRNIPLVLSKEVKAKKPGVIGISTVTDPYQPIENKLHLTRYCLEILEKTDFPISIQTKSRFVLNDKKLIERLSNAEVMVSIGTDDDRVRRLLEPGSSSLDDRYTILKEFADTEVKTSVFLGPIYPTMTVDNIEPLLERFVSLNVDEVMIDRFHIKPGILYLIYEALGHDEELKKLFSYHNLKNYPYDKIREKIRSHLKDTSVHVVDAF